VLIPGRSPTIQWYLGYNKFISNCKPPAAPAWSTLRSGRVSQYEVQFRGNVRRDEVRPCDDGVSDRSVPYVVSETLVLLSDTGLQRQVQLAPTDRLDKQFMSALLRRETILIREIDLGQGQPTRKIDVGAERINLTLGENDGDLNSSLPTPFLDVKNTGGGEGFSLHRLRSDKQGHAELGGFGGTLNCHGLHCSMISNLNHRLIDDFVSQR